LNCQVGLSCQPESASGAVEPEDCAHTGDWKTSQQSPQTT
jgi:hypothetical protein